MQKNRDNNIQTFEFKDLNSNHVVTQTKFESFSFKTLTGEDIKTDKISDDDIRNERVYEKKNNFKINDMVRDSRGLARQEQNDVEKSIQDEVEKRLQAAYEEAYKEGLARGREEGKEEAINQYHEILGQKIESFSETLNQVHAQSDLVLNENKKEVYEFIKRFTKWIVLKEINETVYLENLFEKLILELNARKNLIVKIGRANFAQMPEIIKVVEGKLGQLVNVRVEIVPEIQHPGIILESENGLIDGSLEGVFRNIDKIFEQVNGNE